MKKAPTRSRSPKKPAPKTVLDLAAGRKLVIRSEERMAAVALASKAVREQQSNKDDWRTVKQAMDHYKCDRKTIYLWRREKKMESKKLPGGIRVRLK